MRLVLASLLAACPVAAVALTAGEVAANPAVIGRQECDAGTTEIALTWSVTLETDGTFAADGAFQVYASSTQPTGNYCAIGSAGTGLISTVSKPVSKDQVTPVVVTVSTLLSATALACDSGDKTVYLCAQWNNASGTAKGYAKGQLDLKVAPPAAPVVSKVTIGDTRLRVTIQPATGGTGTPATTDFRARARAYNLSLDPGDYFSSLTPVSGEATIEGLTNGVDYKVTAYAYSSAGNVSPESAAVGPYTPRFIEDAWSHYRDLGGRDSGGCQAGGAGFAALLGVAALLRLRRRA